MDQDSVAQYYHGPHMTSDVVLLGTKKLLPTESIMDQQRLSSIEIDNFFAVMQLVTCFRNLFAYPLTPQEKKKGWQHCTQKTSRKMYIEYCQAFNIRLGYRTKCII